MALVGAAEKMKSIKRYNRPNQSQSSFYKLDGKIYCGNHNHEMKKMETSDDYMYSMSYAGVYFCD